MKINSINLITFGKTNHAGPSNNETEKGSAPKVNSEILTETESVKSQAIKNEVPLTSELGEKIEQAQEMKENALIAYGRAQHLTTELNKKLKEAADARRNSMRKTGSPNLVEKSNEEGKPSKLFIYYPDNKLKLATYFNEDGSSDVIQCDKKGNVTYSKNQTHANKGTKPFIYKTLEEIKTKDGALVSYARSVLDNVYYNETRKNAELINKMPFCMDYSEGVEHNRTYSKIERQTRLYNGDLLQIYSEGVRICVPKTAAELELVLNNDTVVSYKKNKTEN